MTITDGKIIALESFADHPAPYYLFVPKGLSKPRGVLVAVHGITRNAVEHAARLSAYCVENGMILIAPYFSRERFRHFQSLKPGRFGCRPSAVLNDIIADAESRLGMTLTPFTLLGYSGGGQFAHRYALCYPEKVSKLIINAPGWYTLPCQKTAYPEGLALNGDDLDLDFNLENFCKIPTTVIVGADDIRRDKALNKTRSIDKTQGRNRLERARKWTELMNKTARNSGLDPKVELKIIANSGHNFTMNINNNEYFCALTAELSV